MYVARRPIMVPDGEGGVKKLMPGDEVVGFENWDEVAKRANLNLGWVEKVDDLSTPAPKAEKPKVQAKPRAKPKPKPSVKPKAQPQESMS